MSMKIYKQYLDGDIDLTDCNAVLERLTAVINDHDFIPEQKMRCFGLILDSNKEKYISKLKKENAKNSVEANNYKMKYESLLRKIDKMKNGNRKSYAKSYTPKATEKHDYSTYFINAPKTGEVQKKKVVVIKKKKIVSE